VLPQQFVHALRGASHASSIAAEQLRIGAVDGFSEVAQPTRGLAHVVKALDRAVAASCRSCDTVGLPAEETTEDLPRLGVGVVEFEAQSCFANELSAGAGLFCLVRRDDSRMEVAVCRTFVAHEPTTRVGIVHSCFHQGVFGAFRAHLRVARMAEQLTPRLQGLVHLTGLPCRQDPSKYRDDASQPPYDGAVLVQSVGHVGEGCGFGGFDIGRRRLNDAADDRLRRGGVTGHEPTVFRGDAETGPG